MYCPKCGWNNADDATKCSNCFTELAPSQPQQTQQMPPQQAPQQPYAQQQQPYGSQAAQAVPDYMVWSIVVTVLSLFCCGYLPVSVAFGIVAIVKSVSANSKKAMGDFFGAQQDANAAKTWLWWAVGLDIAGLLVAIVYVIFVVLAIGHMPHSGF